MGRGNATGKWASGELHKALVDCLPLFVKEPFSPSPRLDITLLHYELNVTRQSIYRWIKANRMEPKMVMRVVDLANRADNLAVLTQLGRTPPLKEDFSPFIFG